MREKSGLEPHVLPDPTVIWVKAKLFGGHSPAKRAPRRTNVALVAAHVVVAAGWAALLMAKWNGVEEWVGGFTRGYAASLPTDVIMIFAGLVSTTALLAIHTILADE